MSYLEQHWRRNRHRTREYLRKEEGTGSNPRAHGGDKPL